MVTIFSGFGLRWPPPRSGTLTLILTGGLLGWCASWSLCLEMLYFGGRAHVFKEVRLNGQIYASTSFLTLW